MPAAGSDYDPENLIERPEAGLYNFAEIIYRTKGRIPPLCDLQYALASLPPLLPARISKSYLLCREKQQERWKRAMLEVMGVGGGGEGKAKYNDNKKSWPSSIYVSLLAQRQNSWTKDLRVFLLVIRSYLCSFAWDFYLFKLTQPLTVFVKKKEGEPDRKLYPLPYGQEIHTETLSLRTFKIMPRSLYVIVVHDFGFRWRTCMTVQLSTITIPRSWSYTHNLSIGNKSENYATA